MSRRVFAGRLPGERRSKRRGRSVEFDDYRDYTPGDDLRHLDWNVFARFEKFFIKLFREEEDLALHVVVDASASMDAGDPSKLLLAQRLAVALGYIGLVNNNRVLASVFGTPGRAAVRTLGASRGRRNVERVTRFVLDESRPPEEAPDSTSGQPSAPDFASAMRPVARAGKTSGVLVVLSDFLYPEGLPTGLNSLASAGRASGGYDVYCLQILTPAELDPAKDAQRGLIGDLRLTDAETGRAAEVTVTAPLVRKYRRRMDEHCERLRQACAGRGITYAQLSSDADVSQLLTDFLRRRGMLG